MISKNGPKQESFLALPAAHVNFNYYFMLNQLFSLLKKLFNLHSRQEARIADIRFRQL